MAQKIVIMGGGIIGISTAVLLLSQFGHPFSVTIVSDRFTPDTTTDGSGGLWFPYHAEPAEKVNKWALQSYPILADILREHPSLGAMTECELYYRFVDTQDMGWMNSGTFDVKTLSKDEIPSQCNYGYSFSTPVVISWRYLKFLTAEARRLGATFITKKISSFESLAEEFSGADVFINCMGLGSGPLFNDTKIIPARGVIIRAKERYGKQFGKSVGFEDDPDGLTYVISRDDYCIIGGTYDVGNYDLQPTQEEINGIIERTKRIAPELDLVDTGSVWVGLRPSRDTVRVEIDTEYSKPIIHNYGHGGSGLTIHWGCAYEVLSLLKANFPSYKPKL